MGTELPVEIWACEYNREGETCASIQHTTGQILREPTYPHETLFQNSLHLASRTTSYAVHEIPKSWWSIGQVYLLQPRKQERPAPARRKDTLPVGWVAVRRTPQRRQSTTACPTWPLRKGCRIRRGCTTCEPWFWICCWMTQNLGGRGTGNRTFVFVIVFSLSYSL